MALKLSDREIEQRLQKLRNYERLYPKLQKKLRAGTKAD